MESINEFRILEDYLVATDRLVYAEKRIDRERFVIDINNLLEHIPSLIRKIARENCNSCRLHLNLSHECNLDWDILVDRHFREALLRFREEFYIFIDCDLMLEEVKTKIYQQDFQNI